MNCKQCGHEIDNPYWGTLGFCSRACYLNSIKKNTSPSALKEKAVDIQGEKVKEAKPE